MIQFFKDRWASTTTGERLVYLAILILSVILFLQDVEVFLAVIFAAMGINYLLLVFLLSSTQNGLKKEFLVFFLTMAFASLMRCAQWSFTHWLSPQIISCIVAVPIMVSGTHLVMYLYRQKGG